MSKQRNYQSVIEDLLRRSSNDNIYDIISDIVDERSKITTLLENGRPIFENAYGERFNKLHEMRTRLWIKVFAFDNCISIIERHLK